MTSFHRPLAADALERIIENRILKFEQLIDMDGDTVMRTRDGRVETGAAHLMEGY